MIVTQISETSKSRCRVCIDGQFAFVLYKGELRKFHLKEGQEMPVDSYREITEELLPKRAKLRCMNLLQSRDYTRKQLTDKLVQGEYPQECIEEAIAYVESYGYLDDLRYAKDFIEYHISSRSRGRMEMDLMRKGIDRELIRQAFEELDEDGVEQDEASMIKELLLKKNYCPEKATRQEQQKMYGFLYRRGFRTDLIAHVLSL
ncbi:MAG: recombination regulator RecX [Lachnospiraceae bacterium]|nr:recombination regulator RecX [Lachnospiraceae bacterium]